MTAKTDFDVIIIGGGPGGYTAALYTARAGLSTVVFEKLSPGGQMALTSQIDNYPGMIGIDGFELGMKMQAGAEEFGAQTRWEEVLEVSLREDVKKVRTDSGSYTAKVVILATGANPKTLGVEGEAELTGRGVHYCAHCDGMFYRGKTVLVVGGGNSAAADALHLARIAKKVIVVHRRDALKATKIYHEPLSQAENLEFRWNSTVSGLLGDGKLTGVTLKNVITGEEEALDCDGVFVSIGRNPAAELVADQLELDGAGYVDADETTRTGLPGVFAVGDVRSKALRQVVTAVADGAVAAHHAEEYISAGH